jgi:hypothetical protein
MSGGTFDNMRPNIPGNDRTNKSAIDESSDTWDTIEVADQECQGEQWEWECLAYPIPILHSGCDSRCTPGVKASSPQAPISDFF